MESQPQNPEFRINPENFHPCIESRGRNDEEMTFTGIFMVCHLSYISYI